MREPCLWNGHALLGPVCLCLVASPLAAQVSAQMSAKVTTPEQAGGPVRIRVEAPSTTEWVAFFYRSKSAADFESIMLRRESAEVFSGELDTSTLPAGNVDYYLAVKFGAGIGYLPVSAPGTFDAFEVTKGSTPKPTSSGSSATYRYPVHVEGSLEEVLHHQEAAPGERRFTASGQLHVGFERETTEDKVLLDARLAYSNQPYGEQDHLYLAGLQAEYSRGNHHLRAGDLTIQESEYTVSGAGRRGSDYTYDDKHAYAHLFAVNTQQLEGLDGAAWPHADTRLYGGAFGYTFLDGRWNWKLICIDGRDDPSQALNGGFSSGSLARDGSTLALVQEATLLGGRWNLSGEYARSRVDQDLSDSEDEVTGQAWRVGSVYTQGIFTGRVSYHAIGKNFDTLGQTGFVADRIGADASASWAFKGGSLNLTAVDEKTHPTDGTTARNDAQTASVQWTLSRIVTARLGLSHGRQASGSHTDPLVPFSNSERQGGFAGLDFTFGPSATVTTNYQLERLESSDGSAGRSETAVLGGAFTLSPAVRMSPNLTWSRIENQPGDQATRVFSAFLTTDITFIPEWLTFSLAGGHSRTQQPSGTRLTTTTGDASLQFMLSRYMPRKGSCILGLRGRYSRQDNEGQPVQTDNSIALTLNFSM